MKSNMGKSFALAFAFIHKRKKKKLCERKRSMSERSSLFNLENI
jgi:hypothetical protein